MSTAVNRAELLRRIREEERAVLEYLVLKALAGRKAVLEALYDYLIKNESPSEAAEKHGIQKAQLKSAAYQVVSKAKPLIAVRVMKRAWKYLMELEPLVENGYCKVCQAPVHTTHAEPHIAVKHHDIVAKKAEEILAKIHKKK